MSQSESVRRIMAAQQRVCDQCGRRGTRGFITVPRGHGGPTDGVETFTVCANQMACRKRWPKRLGFSEGE